jgi:ATP-binding cassette, subfamily B, bacterial PglK
MDELKQLWNFLSKRRQSQFKATLVLMLIASIFEVVSIGVVLPFLGALTSPDYIYQHPLMEPFITYFQIQHSSNLLLPFTIIFVVAALFSGFIHLLLFYVMTKLAFAAGADLSVDMYRRTLYQEYKVHISLNSSQVINGIITKTNTVISGVLNLVLSLISSIAFIVSIVCVLFLVDAVAATVLFGFGTIYLLIVKYTRKKLLKNSFNIAKKSTQMVKSLQEGLVGVRDVLIDGVQGFYCQMYQKAGLEIKWIKHVQRYPLSNCLYWLAKDKPGGCSHWSFLNSSQLNSLYEQQLASLGITDTIIAGVVNKNSEIKKS